MNGEFKINSDLKECLEKGGEIVSKWIGERVISVLVKINYDEDFKFALFQDNYRIDSDKMKLQIIYKYSKILSIKKAENDHFNEEYLLEKRKDIY